MYMQYNTGLEHRDLSSFRYRTFCSQPVIAEGFFLGERSRLNANLTILLHIVVSYRMYGVLPSLLLYNVAVRLWYVLCESGPGVL